MKLVSASFFWRNDRPDGLGLTFSAASGFSSAELTDMFAGKTVRDYYRESDANLGTQLVESYLAQLASIAAEAKEGPVGLPLALIAAWNIMWLAERGFIPNDEFNGPMLTYVE